jgi:O-antigen biosynthesis protein
VPLAEQLGRNVTSEDSAAAPERFDPEAMHGTMLEAEHLARYWWAAGLVASKRVLDAGCGTAYGSEILGRAGATAVTGVDLDGAVLEAARGSMPENVSLEVADVRELPYPDASFDVAVCFEVIEHVEKPEDVLTELRRVLAPDGLLIVSSPNRNVYPPGNPHHKREFDPDELAAALGARFEHVRLARQHDWLASGVLEDELFGADGGAGFEASLRKTTTARPGGELYTLALASSLPLPAAPPNVVLTQTAEVKWWHEKLRELEAEKDAAVSEIDAALSRERELQELVRDLQELVRKLESMLKRAGAEIGELNDAIRSMQETRVWRLGAAYWNLRDRLLRRKTP